MNPEDFPKYRNDVRMIQKLAENTGVEVLYAAEFDYVPGRMHEFYDKILSEDFDYTIGSVHFTDGFAFDDRDKIEGWRTMGPDRVWSRYADLLGEFVSAYQFEIMAHADLPKIFRYFPADPDVFAKRMRGIFEAAAKKGICLELNTAGLRKDVHEIYPSLALVKAAREAGMRMTFGSDSHNPRDVGAGLKDALALARAAGYSSHVIFRKRQPFEIGFNE